MIESIDIRVTCDECGDDEVIEFGSSSLSAVSDRTLESKLKEIDWHVGEHFEEAHLCDSCWQEKCGA